MQNGSAFTVCVLSFLNVFCVFFLLCVRFVNILFDLILAPKQCFRGKILNNSISKYIFYKKWTFLRQNPNDWKLLFLFYKFIISILDYRILSPHYLLQTKLNQLSWCHEIYSKLQNLFASVWPKLNIFIEKQFPFGCRFLIF